MIFFVFFIQQKDLHQTTYPGNSKKKKNQDFITKIQMPVGFSGTRIPLLWFTTPKSRDYCYEKLGCADDAAKNRSDNPV